MQPKVLHPPMRCPETNHFLFNYAIKRGESAAGRTHLSMAGGIYEVPPDREEILHRCMQTDLVYYGLRTYLVEIRTYVFPMLFDFDFFLPPAAPPITVLLFAEKVLRRVIQVIRLFFPSLEKKTGRGVVCTAASKQVMRDVKVNGKEIRLAMQKYGFHVIFPDVLVDKTNALIVREAVVGDLEKQLGTELITFTDPATNELYEMDTWRTVVDESVIKENGLRMLGANKVDNCPVQHTAVKCAVCDGKK